MTQPIFQVDAFTAEPYAGNPAGVCLLAAPKDARWMQLVAREMNVAETSFLVRREDGADDAESFDLRWFTPTVEVDLCGHATLDAAHMLWETGAADQASRIEFHTRSGVLAAVRAGAWIEMDFPAERAQVVAAPPVELVRALGIDRSALFVGQNRFDYLVELESEAALRAIEPDMRLLSALPVRGVVVTSRADDEDVDFVSRFFAPGAGVDEDPVTGSTHCCLGPYWQERLGRDELVAAQASARGGRLRVRLNGNERVILSGQAVTVLRGELLFD